MSHNLRRLAIAFQARNHILCRNRNSLGVNMPHHILDEAVCPRRRRARGPGSGAQRAAILDDAALMAPASGRT